MNETPAMPKTVLQRLWIFARLAYQRIVNEQTFDESASLAYHTLFSLLPTLVLVVLILSIFSSHRRGGTDGLESQVRTFLYRQFNLDALTAKDEWGNTINVTEEFDNKINKARTVIQHPLTGLIGFAVLLYGATKILLVIEKAFNRIYGGITPRTWARRITLYWTVLTLGPLLAAASLTITNMFYAFASKNTLTQPLLAPGVYVASFFVSWLLMFLLYKIIPGTHVKWLSAMLGAFLAATLVEIGKNAFGIYVRTVVGANNWYGTLALIPLFMFWIYLMWTFALLGLHVAYIHQFFPQLARRLVLKQTSRTTVTDMQWVLPLGVVLVRHFRVGEPVAPHDAAEALNLPADVTADLLASLERAKLVHRLGQSGFVLARPPERISTQDLINAAKALCTLPPDPDPKAPTRTPALQQLEAHQASWYRRHTLADLAGDAHG